MQNGFDMKKDNHNYGIDLLRIAAMLMITAHHFSLHSGIALDPGSAEETIMAVFALGGKTGVNIFVLITGYYASGKIRREKLIGLLGCTSFYSLTLTLAAVLAGSVGFSKKLLLKAGLPLLFGETYWFVVTYLELYILIPVLNKAIENLEKKTRKAYLVCFTGLLCILPSVIGKFIHVNDLGYSPLVWFIYLYYLGAYLRKYCQDAKFCGYILAIAGSVQIAACVISQRRIVDGFLYDILQCFADYNANALCPLLVAVSMLLVFQNMDVRRGRKLLRLLGSATLGIYLFHDNVNFRGLLWNTVYRLVSGFGTGSFLVCAVLCVLLVFALGFAVETVRHFVSWVLREQLFKRANTSGHIIREEKP